MFYAVNTKIKKQIDYKTIVGIAHNIKEITIIEVKLNEIINEIKKPKPRK